MFSGEKKNRAHSYGSTGRLENHRSKRRRNARRARARS